MNAGCKQTPQLTLLRFRLLLPIVARRNCPNCCHRELQRDASLCLVSLLVYIS